MRIFLISIAVSSLGITTTIPARATEEFLCPSMPSAVTQVNHDVRVDMEARVGSLGKVSAGQIAVKADTTAKNLFEKYPHVDRLLTIQMMASTYCSLLRSGSLTSAERARRWEAFSSKVFSMQLGLPPEREARKTPQPPSAETPIVPAVSNEGVSILPAPQRAISKESLLLGEPQPSLFFVVGQDSIAAESVAYLQRLARKLHKVGGIAVRLVPYASREMRANPLSPEALELAFRRQSRVRDVLTKAGMPSPQIVFVRNQAYGNSTDEIFDDTGHPIDWGLSVELIKRDT